MFNPLYMRVRLVLSSVGLILFPLTISKPVQAEETIAYCDSPLYAINVYQGDATEPMEADLNIRIFWREKSLIFADLPASRSHFFSEGFTYTSQSEVSDDYSASLWTLFVPDADDQACLLFRNGAAFDSGDVTQRQMNPGG